MQFSYSLILPYFIQVYLISPKFIMVSYERFTDSLSKYRYGNLFPDSSTHAPCDFHTARTLSGSLCSPPSHAGKPAVRGKRYSPFSSLIPSP